MNTDEKIQRRINLVVTALFIIYLGFLLLMVLKCLKSDKNTVKINLKEQEYIYNSSESGFEYKDLSKINLSEEDISIKKKSYYEHLHKKCQE